MKHAHILTLRDAGMNPGKDEIMIWFKKTGA